jgi:hypothetical protein
MLVQAHKKQAECAQSIYNAKKAIKEQEALAILSGAKKGKNAEQRKANVQEWLDNQPQYVSAKLELDRAERAAIEPRETIALQSKLIMAIESQVRLVTVLSSATGL